MSEPMTLAEVENCLAQLQGSKADGAEAMMANDKTRDFMVSVLKGYLNAVQPHLKGEMGIGGTTEYEGNVVLRTKLLVGDMKDGSPEVKIGCLCCKPPPNKCDCC